jgi:hypothetical protein
MLAYAGQYCGKLHTYKNYAPNMPSPMTSGGHCIDLFMMLAAFSTRTALAQKKKKA